ncbi:MAG: hypothetical protein ACRC62_35555 [Microcoleus sp.]
MLVNQPKATTLTRQSDHVTLPACFDGFGTTITKIVEITGGDIVQVLSADATILVGIVGICAVGSGPLAIVTVPASILAGLGIAINDFLVCQQYQNYLDSLAIGDEYQSGNYFAEMPEYSVNSCADCHHFQSDRDRNNPSNGQCLKYGDSANATEWCQGFELFQSSRPQTIAVQHNTVIPEPVQTPPALPPAAKPTMVSTGSGSAKRATVPRSALISEDEELAIAASLPVPRREVELSPIAQQLHDVLTAHLKKNPGGWTNTIAQFSSNTGFSAEESKEFIKELAAKRPEQYQMQNLPEIRLIVRGVA